jgi:hypothetical protein
MRRDILEFDERRGRAEMRGLVVSDDLDEFNYELRRMLGRGFTKDGKTRWISNIDGDELAARRLSGDRDAIAFTESGYKDREALRRLLRRFPQWRCSEGCV